MLGRVAALLIWIGSYYYDLWNIIPKKDHAILSIGLLILFIADDGPIISYKKIIETVQKKGEQEEWLGKLRSG